MPTESSHCICISVVLIESVFQMGKNYYPQVLLEECKYIVKKEVTRHINKELDISSDDSDKSDEEKFSFNKRSKKYHEHENFLLCKLLLFLENTLNYTLNYTLKYTINYTISFLGYSYTTRYLLTQATWYCLGKKNS